MKILSRHALVLEGRLSPDMADRQSESVQHIKDTGLYRVYMLKMHESASNYEEGREMR